MYLEYDEYVEYGGTLDETTFGDFAWEAQTWVDWYTFKRLEKDANRLKEKGISKVVYPEAVKRCMYRLIRLAQQKAEAMTLGASSGGGAMYGKSTSAMGTPSIASQSNDGVSISYNTMSASEIFGILNAKGAGNIIEDTVKLYLNDVRDSLGRKLLYRGIYEDE